MSWTATGGESKMQIFEYQKSWENEKRGQAETS